MLLPARVRCFFDECLAEKRKVSPYNAIWWWQQQTLRKLMKNMTRKSWIFWNWQSLPELSDLEKSDLKIRSRSVKKRSTIRSRSWSRKMVESDLRSDQKVICRSRSWSVDQDRHYFVLYCVEKKKLWLLYELVSIYTKSEFVFFFSSRHHFESVREWRAAYQSVQSSDRDRNSEVCAQALLPKLDVV